MLFDLSSNHAPSCSWCPSPLGLPFVPWTLWTFSCLRAFTIVSSIWQALFPAHSIPGSFLSLKSPFRFHLLWGAFPGYSLKGFSCGEEGKELLRTTQRASDWVEVRRSFLLLSPCSCHYLVLSPKFCFVCFVGNIDNLVQIFQIITLIRDYKIPGIISFCDFFILYPMLLTVPGKSVLLTEWQAAWQGGCGGAAIRIHINSVPSAVWRRNLVPHWCIRMFYILKVNCYVIMYFMCT